MHKISEIANPNDFSKIVFITILSNSYAILYNLAIKTLYVIYLLLQNLVDGIFFYQLY